ncbi:MAG: M29 family metallopeptidase [Nitrososphaerales archaeon]
MNSKRKKSKSGASDAYSQLASKVVNESLKLKPGETLTVETWNRGLPFAKQVVMEARKIGAIPLMIVEDEEAYVFGIKNSPKDAVGKMGKHEYAMLSGTDAYVFIPGPPVGIYNPMLTKEEASYATGYNPSWYEAADKAKLRGARVTFGYVGKDLAKLLGKKYEEIIMHQVKSSLVDFAALTTMGMALVENLPDDGHATLSTNGVKLGFTLKGEVVVEDGIIDDRDVSSGNNMGYLPAGMIEKEVDPASVNGAVNISDSITKLGLVSGATLHFEGGKMTRWTGPKKAIDKLDQLIGLMPESNRAIKFITIGFNPEMKFGYAQDRFVSGSIGIGGFGFTGILRKSTLAVNGKTLTDKGKIMI